MIFIDGFQRDHLTPYGEIISGRQDVFMQLR
jgi:hypothetical protein